MKKLVVLFTFLRKNGLQKRYGLCKSSVPARRFLFYVPLVILASGNLWNGAAVNYAPAETVCRIVCMLCVGFLEEVIFRGLLFAAKTPRLRFCLSMTFRISSSGRPNAFFAPESRYAARRAAAKILIASIPFFIRPWVRVLQLDMANFQLKHSNVDSVLW